MPCDTKRIQEIADKYGLKVIYDAAHAFGVKIDGESILRAGDQVGVNSSKARCFLTIPMNFSALTVAACDLESSSCKAAALSFSCLLYTSAA